MKISFCLNVYDCIYILTFWFVITSCSSDHLLYLPFLNPHSIPVSHQLPVSIDTLQCPWKYPPTSSSLSVLSKLLWTNQQLHKICFVFQLCSFAIHPALYNHFNPSKVKFPSWCWYWHLHPSLQISKPGLKDSRS